LVLVVQVVLLQFPTPQTATLALMAAYLPLVPTYRLPAATEAQAARRPLVRLALAQARRQLMREQAVVPRPRLVLEATLVARLPAFAPRLVAAQVVACHPGMLRTQAATAASRRCSALLQVARAEVLVEPVEWATRSACGARVVAVVPLPRQATLALVGMAGTTALVVVEEEQH
jgi:hypothetical protein